MGNETIVATVADFKYLRKNVDRFIFELRNEGKFNGNLLIITSVFTPTFLIRSIRKDKNIIVKRFRKIRFSRNAENILRNLDTGKEPNRHLSKRFQWHKLHLFDSKIKKWRYVFYLDINMKIHSDINLILIKKPENKLYARSDSYPEYKRLLSSQFDNMQTKYKSLSSEYDLNTSKYFQTGVMYFDTLIINSYTKKRILDVVERFPISTTNEQGILNIFFKYIENRYTELDTEVEDYLTYYYWLVKNKKIIITKQNRYKYK
jgi:hypothetical protein